MDEIEKIDTQTLLYYLGSTLSTLDNMYPKLNNSEKSAILIMWVFALRDDAPHGKIGEEATKIMAHIAKATTFIKEQREETK